MSDHEPSSLIPLYDGMVISFINYEIRVNLEKKDSSDLEKEETMRKQKLADMTRTAQLASTFKV